MRDFVFGCMDRVLAGQRLGRADLEALTRPEADVYDLMYAANRVRQHFCGNEIKFCSIVNAKSGNCSEDCTFCAQSSRYETGINKYPILKKEEILRAAKEAAGNGASCFGFVIAKRGPSDKDVEFFSETLEEMEKTIPIRRGGSLGVMNLDKAQKLAQAGQQMLNHNLETSRRRFGKICSTHTYDERLDTIRNLKTAGMKVCSGGIFGMGEEWRDRLDLLETLIELNVDSVPMNFLHPVEGTPLGNSKPLPPMEILRTISIFRLGLPKQEIRICGGRETNLRDMQSWMFYAGANGAMLGNYLTTSGRPLKEDVQMVKDLGMMIAGYKPQEKVIA